eukprot:TRINITY_DN278_c0_g1_i1.p1 TRINITY_DN278_c0_g1~~TRINITY_DN278_c0_g1_i1.p1  ORF type:complete len:155 (-),score=35.31 TRINITY_DN278_c0_g1_i1:39-503(-)
MGLFKVLFILLSLAAAILPGLIKISDLHPLLNENFGEARKPIQEKFEKLFVPYAKKLIQQELPPTNTLIHAIGLWEISLGLLSLFSNFFTFLLVITMGVACGLHSQTDGFGPQEGLGAVIVLAIHLLRFVFVLCGRGNSNDKNSKKTASKKKTN